MNTRSPQHSGTFVAHYFRYSDRVGQKSSAVPIAPKTPHADKCKHRGRHDPFGKLVLASEFARSGLATLHALELLFAYWLDALVAIVLHIVDGTADGIRLHKVGVIRLEHGQKLLGT